MFEFCLISSHSFRYTYNDTIWLCDKLGEFVESWGKREDLVLRARNLVKLGPEIDKLASFGKRAYSSELTSQRTIIDDFLGGLSPLSLTRLS